MSLEVLTSPRIVAIETSGRLGSVVVAAGVQVLAERELATGMRHAVELMPAVRDLVAAAGWKPEDIEQLYLSIGPGSFTGLRIAVAMARAMALALPALKLVGVPSLDVIAQNAPAEAVLVLPILDAKRGQVFAACYERQTDGLLRQTVEPGLVDPAAFVRDAAERASTLGGQVAVLGEGVDYHREALFGGAATNVFETDLALWPGRARMVHRLGFARAMAGEFADPMKLFPLYIRLPEAEEVWRKKMGVG